MGHDSAQQSAGKDERFGVGSWSRNRTKGLIMSFRTALIGVATAALLAPVSLLIAVTPAAASNDVRIRVDPAHWSWTGTITVMAAFCEDGAYASDDECSYDATKPILQSTAFTASPGSGLQDVLDVTWEFEEDHVVFLTNNTLTGNGVTRRGDDLEVYVASGTWGGEKWRVTKTTASGAEKVNANFGKPGGQYELKFYPADTYPPSRSTVRASVSAAIDGGDGCTVRGTPGDDVLDGTSGDDVICGFGGDDVIRGRGGDDVIHAGSGNDTVYGGRGDDTTMGGGGDDTIHGGRGADDIHGGAGRDTIHHTRGHDWVHRGDGKDKFVNVARFLVPKPGQIK